MRVLVFCLVAVAAYASQSHQDGQDFSKNLIEDVKGAAKSTNPKEIPGFETQKPSQASLTASTIGDAALKENSVNPASDYIHEQFKDRKTYKIDPQKDPLLTQANQATEDPFKTLKGDPVEEEYVHESKETWEVCMEGGDEFMQTCTKRLVVNVHVQPEYKVQHKRCPGHKEMSFDWGWAKSVKRRWNCEGCETYEETIPKQVSMSEHWEDDCKVLEQNVDEGLCSYESMRYGAPETRYISGEPIYRPRFEEVFTYKCFKEIESNCDQLRARGCVQIKSECKEKQAGTCVAWTQTFRCGGEVSRQKITRAPGQAFCLTGDCADSSYFPNTEMFEAISHLAVLREAQQDIRNKVNVFKGQDRRCTRNCANFRDCCGNGKGWGISLHLTECSALERELADLRKQAKCVSIGTYCAERFLGICIRKKSTFCCFGNKLSRLVQEQGRAQLDLDWGSPEEPDCEGLTLEELSAIDLSKIDFSEFFDDIKAQLKLKEPKEVAPSLDRLKDNMARMGPKSGAGL